ncbi:MAG: extracellular solute-binding protein [Treponema sp.]|nr:extracellular solute-binding protein [Treponema sp.]
MKKVICILLVCLIVTASIFGRPTAEKKAADTTRRENLVFYLMGDAPRDIELIKEKLNELLLPRINATMTFNFSSWTDWVTKYNMVLSSGEPCDLIYTANWMNYAALANNDAFVPLDDLLPAYAPDVWNLIPPSTWNQMRVKGKIYSVPASKREYNGGGVMYREDLRAKYNLPVPDSLENIEAYALGIKKNEPNQNIMSGSVLSGSFGELFGAVSVFNFIHGWAGAPVYGIVADYNNPSKPYDYWSSPAFRDDMKLMKRWADLGFWSRSALSEANDAAVFNNGGSVLVVSGHNPAKYIGVVEDFKQNRPDWSAKFVTYASKNGIAFGTSPIANGTAIPVSSRRPERAAMALNLLYTDQVINRLVMYGVEGTHYTVSPDGYYVKGPKGNDFGYEGISSWNLRNPVIGLSRESDKELDAIFAGLRDIAMKTNTPDVDLATGFMEDYSSYSAERAALSTVLVQYLAPLQAGLVNDVDRAVDEFLQRAKVAGLEKIQGEYIRQWVAYCNEYGYR